MNTFEYLGLDPQKEVKVVEGLKKLLADLQVYYTNLRGLHWNVRGKQFFALHEKYEEYYDDAADKIDEVAERLVQLGVVAEHRYSEYVRLSDISEDIKTERGGCGIQVVLDMLGVLIRQEREIAANAAEASDDVTVALMDDFLASQEKNVWMLVASSAKRPTDENHGAEGESCGCKH